MILSIKGCSDCPFFELNESVFSDDYECRHPAGGFSISRAWRIVVDKNCPILQEPITIQLAESTRPYNGRKHEKEI